MKNKLEKKIIKQFVRLHPKMYSNRKENDEEEKKAKTN